MGEKVERQLEFTRKRQSWGGPGQGTEFRKYRGWMRRQRTWRLMGREETQADVEEERVFLKNSCSFWASLSCNSVPYKEAPNTDACWECDTDPR